MVDNGTEIITDNGTEIQEIMVDNGTAIPGIMAGNGMGILAARANLEKQDKQETLAVNQDNRDNLEILMVSRDNQEILAVNQGNRDNLEI